MSFVNILIIIIIMIITRSIMITHTHTSQGSWRIRIYDAEKDRLEFYIWFYIARTLQCTYCNAHIVILHCAHYDFILHEHTLHEHTLWSYFAHKYSDFKAHTKMLDAWHIVHTFYMHLPTSQLWSQLYMESDSSGVKSVVYQTQNRVGSKFHLL